MLSIPAPPLRLCPGLLRYDAESLRFSFAFRISCVIQCIPSPVAPERRVGGLSHHGVNLLVHSMSMCELFNATPEARLTMLPTYILFELAVVLIVLRRSLALMKSRGDNWDVVNESVFGKAVARMTASIGSLPAKMLELTEDPHLDNQFSDVDVSALFGSLPTDWLNAFGLSADWLVAPSQVQS